MITKKFTKWINVELSSIRLLLYSVLIILLAVASTRPEIDLFLHNNNLSLYKSFLILAVLILIWRKGLGLPDEAFRAPFSQLAKENSTRLKWWQFPILVVLMFIYGLCMQLILNRIGITSIPNQNVSAAPSTLTTFLIQMFAILPQVGIEEMVTLTLLIIIATLCTRWFNLSNQAALVIGLIISTLLFSSLHYAAYSWHLMQMFLIIGGSRIILSLVFLRSRSLYDTYITHYAYDVFCLLLATIAP